jgi:hypothetical protein
VGQGGPWGEKKVPQVRFFGGCGTFPAIFFIAFLNSPCYETPENAIKKIEQNNRGRKKENGGGKKTTFFVRR